jgi:hypothetical protein
MVGGGAMGPGSTIQPHRERQPFRCRVDDPIGGNALEGVVNPSLLDKLDRLKLALSRDKGAFDLFGVFLREDSPEKWDLVVAAPWLTPDERESFKTIADGLQSTLTREEVLQFSRIVILEKGNPFLESVIARVSVEHGLSELDQTELSGVSIRRAYILTARRRLARKRRRNTDSSPAR